MWFLCVYDYCFSHFRNGKDLCTLYTTVACFNHCEGAMLYETSCSIGGRSGGHFVGSITERQELCVGNVWHSAPRDHCLGITGWNLDTYPCFSFTCRPQLKDYLIWSTSHRKVSLKQVRTHLKYLFMLVIQHEWYCCYHWDALFFYNNEMEKAFEKVTHISSTMLTMSVFSYYYANTNV